MSPKITRGHKPGLWFSSDNRWQFSTQRYGQKIIGKEGSFTSHCRKWRIGARLDNDHEWLYTVGLGWPCSFATRQDAVAALEEALSAEINLAV